jgi:hypothetical protein
MILKYTVQGTGKQSELRKLWNGWNAERQNCGMAGLWNGETAGLMGLHNGGTNGTAGLLDYRMAGLWNGRTT